MAHVHKYRKVKTYDKDVRRYRKVKMCGCGEIREVMTHERTEPGI